MNAFLSWPSTSDWIVSAAAVTSALIVPTVLLTLLSVFRKPPPDDSVACSFVTSACSCVPSFVSADFAWVPLSVIHGEA